MLKVTCDICGAEFDGYKEALDLAIKALYADQEWSEMRKEKVEQCQNDL